MGKKKYLDLRSQSGSALLILLILSLVIIFLNINSFTGLISLSLAKRNKIKDSLKNLASYYESILTDPTAWSNTRANNPSLNCLNSMPILTADEVAACSSGTLQPYDVDNAIVPLQFNADGSECSGGSCSFSYIFKWELISQTETPGSNPPATIKITGIPSINIAASASSTIKQSVFEIILFKSWP